MADQTVWATHPAFSFGNKELNGIWVGKFETTDNYVNDFLYRGRVKKVMVQADAPYRMTPENVDQWYVRNNQGAMVPLRFLSSFGLLRHI